VSARLQWAAALHRARVLAVVCALGAASVLPAQAIHPDTSSDTVAHRRVQPLPAIASAPETGLQYGATVLAVWQPAAVRRTRPSSLTASALRTAKDQSRVRVEGEYWTRGNAQRIAASLQWQRFPLLYYGIGDHTPSSAAETFTPTGTEATLSLQQRIAGTWYVTAGVRHVDQRIATDTAGVLRARSVPGAAGGVITEWSGGVMTDTRDNLFAPRAGHLVQLSYARSAADVWSDYTYGTMRVDARSYHAIATEHVIATQLQVTRVDGTTPFDQLALVGNGDILRGYARGRYRDRAVAAVQGEYRSPIRHRVGAVIFAGAGAAAPSLESITSHRILPTYGAGLRFQIDERQRTAVRADYGRGRDGASGLYIGFNQAF
jgi:hypothetical protein